MIHLAHDRSEGPAQTRNEVADDLKRALERVWGVGVDTCANVGDATICRLHKSVDKGIENG